MNCPYCQQPARFVTGKELYPLHQSLAKNYYYVCRRCDASVGCHKGTNKPLGNLANRELREARGRAHKAFDPIWRKHGINRNDAYKWLAEQMELTKSECHMAKMSIAECARVVELATAYRQLLSEVPS